MFTIKEAAKKTGVSEHTLRFWARSGFFPFIKRDENNIRKFSENDLEWVKIVKCLRAAGAQNKDIKKYIDLCIEGDITVEERYEIIKKTKQSANLKMEELKSQIDLLEFKEKYYLDLIENKTKDYWNPMNKK